MSRHSTRKWCVGLSAIVILALIAALIIYLSLRSNKETKFVSDAPLGIYEHAAVSTLGMECAQIGSDLLKRNGSAVDAAIASLLCEGIASPHSMGLGGGFLMTIYDAKTGEATFLDARETAPASANENMFGGNGNSSLYGGLSVAVPGELKGYWVAHQKYGKLPWKDLFEASIELCYKGAEVNEYLYSSLKRKEQFIRDEPTLREIFINPINDRLYNVGEYIKRPKLGRTLELLANSSDPVGLFYKGDIAKNLVREILEYRGNMTLEDFANYEVKWREPIKAHLGNLTIYTAPPPGSGALLGFMMNVLSGFDKSDIGILWQRMIETFKWAYAQRTKLGDTDFVDGLDALIANLTSQDYADKIRSLIEDDKTYTDPKHYGADYANINDHGTSHVTVLAQDGSAVSVTSTINQVLGAKFRSNTTGIIFNDEMDDFSSPNITNGFDLPPSPNNYIRPHKRPLSSMTPTIAVDERKKEVQLVIGAAGGTKITTAIASIMLLNLQYGYDIKEAVDEPRLHHQLMPMKIEIEDNFNEQILQQLRRIGHKTDTFVGIGSAVTAIERDGHGKILANSDYRRQGKTAGF